VACFGHPEFDHHEDVTFVADRASGLRAIIAIHDTALGPALGGCRIHPYATETDALTDVLRLSRGMTFKGAAAGLDLGGGKAVIIADPHTEKTPALLRAMGRAVERMGGRFTTAEDIGMNVEDVAEMHRETRHVVGLPTALGGSGDPSPTTARGIFHAMRAAVRHRYGAEGFAGMTVAIQGLGNVGRNLAEQLHAEGARLVVCDTVAARVERAVAELRGPSRSTPSWKPRRMFSPPVRWAASSTRPRSRV